MNRNATLALRPRESLVRIHRGGLMDLFLGLTLAAVRQSHRVRCRARINGKANPFTHPEHGL